MEQVVLYLVCVVLYWYIINKGVSFLGDFLKQVLFSYISKVTLSAKAPMLIVNMAIILHVIAI